ncbi:MAG: hypothetical protein CSB55_02180 [Candidatus Cloacimonadota bacterium]|nr:MAG: hypothetical protein CSB55_02180 [Candidatus Cloacimonadota bacterium]
MPNGTYWFAVRYQDANGNPKATSTWVQAVIDGTTQNPTMVSVSPQVYAPNDNFQFSYNLPEEALVGSIHLEFWNQDHTSLLSDMTLTGNNTAGQHTITLTDDNKDGLFDNDSNSSVDNMTNNLQNGTEYYCYIKYKDQYGNDYATSIQDNISFEYDNETEEPTLDIPNNNNSFGDVFNLQFDIPEAGQDNEMTVTFQGQGTTGDNTAHVFRINDESAGTDRRIDNISGSAIGNHAGLTLVSGSNSLTDGEEYLITLTYKDQYGNEAASAVNANQDGKFVYNQSNTKITFEKVELGAKPFDGSNSTNNKLLAFKVYAASGVGQISSLKFDLEGSATAADFAANGFRLYESSDNQFDPASDTEIWTGTHNFGSSITFSGADRDISVNGKYYFLVADLSADTDEDHRVRAKIQGTASVGYTADEISGTWPIIGSWHDMDGTIAIEGGDYGNGYTLGANENDKPVFWFSMKTNQGVDYLSQIQLSLGGSAVANDFKANGFQLYKNSSNDFDGATAIWSSLNYGSNLTFSGSDIALNTTETYFFLTVDVSETADIDHNISASLSCSDTNPVTDYGNLYGDDKVLSGGTHSLPVELSSFTLSNHGKTVILEWTTQTETDNRGFNIYRGVSPDDMENGQVIHVNREGEIKGQLYSANPTDYVYKDNRNIEYGKEYYYWLETVDGSGFTQLLQPIPFKPEQVTQQDIIEFVERGLHENYPNPFNPTTTISFYFETARQTVLDIYNVKGQRVKRLFDGMSDPSKINKVEWNGKDDKERDCASGVYFYKIKAGDYEKINRMCIMK